MNMKLYTPFGTTGSGISTKETLQNEFTDMCMNHIKMTKSQESITSLSRLSERCIAEWD